METKDLEQQRINITAKITKIDGMRQGIFAQEKERQQKIAALNTLQTKRIKREGELANDTSGIKSLLDEKAKTESELSTMRQAVTSAISKAKIRETILSGKKNELASHNRNLDSVRNELKAINEQTESSICFNCGQELPANLIAKSEKKKQATIAEIEKTGHEIQIKVAAVVADIGLLEKEKVETLKEIKAAETALVDSEQEKAKRFAEIDELIKNNPKPDPAKDEVWQKIIAEILEVESQVGEPVSEQLQALDNRRSILNGELAEVNKALAAADRAVQDKARIAELEAKEKQLAQQLADIERQLAMIGDYTQKVSALIESAVNGKFKHVKFKLFETQFNGGIVDACEATFNGVPYSDLSTGQQILVGIDVINTLSEHYGINVVLFIDHFEALTFPIKTNSQTVCLQAVSGIKKLTITRKEVLQNVE